MDGYRIPDSVSPFVLFDLSDGDRALFAVLSELARSFAGYLPADGALLAHLCNAPGSVVDLRRLVDAELLTPAALPKRVREQVVRSSQGQIECGQASMTVGDCGQSFNHQHQSPRKETRKKTRKKTQRSRRKRHCRPDGSRYSVRTASPAFIQAWRTYPRHESGYTAVEEWEESALDELLPEILHGIRERLRFEDAARRYNATIPPDRERHRVFIYEWPWFVNYLRGERWYDDPTWTLIPRQFHLDPAERKRLEKELLSIPDDVAPTSPKWRRRAELVELLKED